MPMDLRWRRLHIPQTMSTQEDLERLAVEEGAPEGFVVRADVQRAGRGRAGRSWSSPRGGLWCSVLLRPDREDWGLLPLLAGSAVAQTLLARGVPAELKWPNDVLVDGRKVAGVVAAGHTRPRPFVVLGVGVNANFSPDDLPAEVAKLATTLQEVRGRPVDLEDLFDGLLDALGERYLAWGRGEDEALVTEWRRLCPSLGHRVRLPGRDALGQALDVTREGALVVELVGGDRVEVTSGDDVEWTRYS